MLIGALSTEARNKSSAQEEIQRNDELPGS